uniref:ADP,ATP carrier protein n=1 Tax=Angiostrongylus cantonensis TaxID=6313 RepID=A0A0K0CST5_ANGCA
SPRKENRGSTGSKFCEYLSIVVIVFHITLYQKFSSGAATVGEAFGIDTRAYQAPLFSAATQLFGRR